MALFFGAAIGLLWLGTVPLTSGLVVVFFGSKHVTMLYGMVFLSHQVGSFLELGMLVIFMIHLVAILLCGVLLFPPVFLRVPLIFYSDTEV